MSARSHKSTRRSYSIENQPKTVLNHVRLALVPQNAILKGISSDANIDTVVFEIGTKKNGKNSFFVSFKEASQYNTFKNYLHKVLIPTIGHNAGRGVSYIFKGNANYLMIKEADNEAATDSLPENEPVDATTDSLPENEPVDGSTNSLIQPDEQAHTSRKRPHDVEILPSVSTENEINEEVVEEHAPKRAKFTAAVNDETPKSSFTQSQPNKRNGQQAQPQTFSHSTNSSSMIDFQPTKRKSNKYLNNLDISGDDEFIENLMFDKNAPELEVASRGIDPSLVHSLSYNTKSPILSRSIEIDDEPFDGTPESLNGTVEIYREQPIRRSFCTII